MTPEYVMETKTSPVFLQRIVFLPRIPWILPQPDLIDKRWPHWQRKYGWLYSYSVYPRHLEEAKSLKSELEKACAKHQRKHAKALIKRLYQIRLPPFEEQSRTDQWDFMMAQMPEDMGGPNKSKIRDILSSRIQGRVLEAMCGFRSYFTPSPTREVVAMDFSREALQQYPYPERTRILFDLNQLASKPEIGFFQDREFDVVCICFGASYLTDEAEVKVYSEFRRILKTSGRVILVENHAQAYGDLAFRRFHRPHCRSVFEKSGFPKVVILEMPIAEEWERRHGGRYFFVEASKH